MKVSLGIDIGSTFTKLCVMAESRDIISLSSFATPVDQRFFFENLLDKLNRDYDICAVTSCGYGKENIGVGAAVSELVALSKGIGLYYSGTQTVLDIGGQDSKVIQCENGKLRRFFLNDKCAAGSGLFLCNVLRILDMNFEQLGIGTAEIKPLSTVCAVFAQTEIIRGISSGKSGQELAESAIFSILKQASSLLRPEIKRTGKVIFTGGMTLIRGIDQLLSSIIGCEVIIPQHSIFLTAIGCASGSLKNKSSQQI